MFCFSNAIGFVSLAINLPLANSKLHCQDSPRFIIFLDIIMAHLIRCNEHACYAEGTQMAWGPAGGDVLEKAKKMFIKRNKTVYRWLHPEETRTYLDTTLSAAWDDLPAAEKGLYISEATVHVAISVLLYPFAFTARQGTPFACAIQ
jgi:hypothetical protein